MKVLSFGTFDILHPGHIYFLKQAKKLGTHLTTVIARDCNVIKFKHKKAINKEAVRLLKLRQLGFIDQVLLGDKTDIYKVLHSQKPDIIALGYDQHANLNYIQEHFSHIQIQRINSFYPKQYKTSILCNILKKV